VSPTLRCMTDLLGFLSAIFEGLSIRALVGLALFGIVGATVLWATRSRPERRQENRPPTRADAEIDSGAAPGRADRENNRSDRSSRSRSHSRTTGKGADLKHSATCRSCARLSAFRPESERHCTAILASCDGSQF